MFVVEDDWELAHRKLAGIHSEGTHEAEVDDWLRKKGFGVQQDNPKSTSSRDDEDELDREEVWVVRIVPYLVTKLV